MTIIPARQVERAAELARRISKRDSRNYKLERTFAGLLGEIGFERKVNWLSRIYGPRVRLEWNGRYYEQGGDGGVDFRWNDWTIDVKTHEKMRVPQEKKADIYVQVKIVSGREVLSSLSEGGTPRAPAGNLSVPRISVVGWALSEDVAGGRTVGSDTLKRSVKDLLRTIQGPKPPLSECRSAKAGSIQAGSVASTDPPPMACRCGAKRGRRVTVSASKAR